MGTQTTTIERARKYLAAVPPAICGQRGHDQTFSAACALSNGFALDEQTTLDLLNEYNPRCEPPWSESELRHKVRSAISTAHTKPRGYLLGQDLPPASRVSAPVAPRPAAPKPIDPRAAVEQFLGGFRCDEESLWNRSPIRPGENWKLDGLALIRALFNPGEQVNFVVKHWTAKDGKPMPDRGLTFERDFLLRTQKSGLPASDAGAWLRINPVDGKGINDQNITRHRFALLECDGVPTELQLALFTRLPLPISAILTSGGRSVHAWVRVDACDKNDYDSQVSHLHRYLARFGIDPQNKNCSRLSRLPGVIRKIGAHGDGRQRLLYLHPEPTSDPIL